MKVAFIIAAMYAGSVHSTVALDYQDRVAEEAIKDGMILVRNDTVKPYEVKTQDIGKHLLCMSLDYKMSGLIPVTKSMFPKNESIVLVRCRDGKFYFTRGYV